MLHGHLYIIDELAKVQPSIEMVSENFIHCSEYTSGHILGHTIAESEA
jgi:hypothetical protein